MGSDEPEATSFETGAGSPESFSTSHAVSLSPEMMAVPFVPWNSVRSVYPGQNAVAAWNHAGGAGAVAHHRVHHVLRFDLVQRAQLPVAK